MVEYTPDSLVNLIEPPKFFLRPVTERERRRLRKLAIQEGLRSHDVAKLREETLNGLRELWSEQVFAEQEGRLRAFWDAYDQHEQEQEGKEDPEPFEHPDKAAMMELSERITRAWAPLLRMVADNNEWDETWPKLIASITVAGWRDLDARYERSEGIVGLDCLDEMEKALDAVEAQAMTDQVDGVIGHGTAFRQLIVRCIRLFSVSKAEEKNSESPSKSSTTPNTSKASGKEQKAGSSAAKNSSETLAN
ncbi:hypothetical protein OOT33_13670 [Sphingobium sp. DEHP117]|uniref:hypothetical protein n=1 Tax=Sphingobium sp. DEHP117 TaxID=2993436 RepID=UPI0027D5D007|nr:hypothetical protein [Sphingobium sp. DEHP117]MDQ4421471.1 hypothetical protein [Sphingobium sp. DEHP117]